MYKNKQKEGKEIGKRRKITAETSKKKKKKVREKITSYLNASQK